MISSPSEFVSTEILFNRDSILAETSPCILFKDGSRFEFLHSSFLGSCRSLPYRISIHAPGFHSWRMVVAPDSRDSHGHLHRLDLNSHRDVKECNTIPSHLTRILLLPPPKSFFSIRRSVKYICKIKYLFCRAPS